MKILINIDGTDEERRQIYEMLGYTEPYLSVVTNYKEYSSGYGELWGLGIWTTYPSCVVAETTFRFGCNNLGRM